jgi:hypothetical protein
VALGFNVEPNEIQAPWLKWVMRHQSWLLNRCREVVQNERGFGATSLDNVAHSCFMKAYLASVTADAQYSCHEWRQDASDLPTRWG